ncbi:hypothetical protein DVH24_000910 [Malus domestica]|uniref:UDP-glycosyltransferases domain-containing protein n=1 Tax=Malus domestica TaxID=3750 RepID=A0A498JZR8_MALDO|nr:hypothetical protein DVH24_000910 [Malus domestica]
MAHGHLIPFLQLARNLQQRKSLITVTIASTALNIQYLRTTIASNSSSQSDSNIRLAELSFCGTDHGLPPNGENTENLPISKIGNLVAASTSLEAPARHIISDIIEKEGRPPPCIISDMYFGWATNLANSFGTAHVTFTTGGAYGTAALVSVWLNLPHRSTASDEFPVPGFPESYRFHISQLNPYLRAADGTDFGSRIFQPQLSLSTKSFGKEFGIPPEACLEWLDSQGSDSVVYVSFGSQNSISSNQMMELALVLEESGRPFIWVTRPPVGYDMKGGFRAEWLPEGFED